MHLLIASPLSNVLPKFLPPETRVSNPGSSIDYITACTASSLSTSLRRASSVILLRVPLLDYSKVDLNPRVSRWAKSTNPGLKSTLIILKQVLASDLLLLAASCTPSQKLFASPASTRGGRQCSFTRWISGCRCSHKARNHTCRKHMRVHCAICVSRPFAKVWSGILK